MKLVRIKKNCQCCRSETLFKQSCKCVLYVTVTKDMHKASKLFSSFLGLALLLCSETRYVPCSHKSLRLQYRRNDEMLDAVVIVYKDSNFILAFSTYCHQLSVLFASRLNRWKHLTPGQLQKAEMLAEKMKERSKNIK